MQCSEEALCLTQTPQRIKMPSPARVLALKNPRALSSFFRSPTPSLPTPSPSPPTPSTSPSSPSRLSMKSIVQDIFNETNFQSLIQKFKSSSRSSRFRCKHRVYSVTVRRLAAANLHHFVVDIIEHHKQFPEIATEGFAVRLISLYGQAGMFTDARKLFDELPQLKCPRTVKSINAVLTAALDCKLFSKVVELFDTLPPEISVKPDVFSYSILIQAFCKIGYLDSAISKLEEMELHGVKPCVITFNVLLNGLYLGDRFSDAEKIWMTMRENNCVPDIISYNERLRGLVLMGKTDDAVQLFGELKSQGLKPNISSFNSLIRGYCNDGNLEEVKRIFSELANNDCDPNKTSFEFLIPFACQKGDLDFAVTLCKDCINRRCFVDSGVFQSVIDVLGTESRIKDAKKLVELAKLKKFFPKSGLRLPSGIE
ncbi:hypothetical protein ACLOJK_039665 [Asimina triloba]